MRLRRFSFNSSGLEKFLSALVLGMAIVLYVLGRLLGYDAEEMLKVSVALVVAAIPEGLLVALTVVLAIGMQRMHKRKALIRRLVAAETLGSVSVVCTDKTGTLTEGRMSVARAVTPKHDVVMDERIPDDVYDMFVALALNNDASVTEGKTVGHPTEVALLEGALKVGLNVEEKRDQFPRRAEIPFRSALKYGNASYGRFQNASHRQGRSRGRVRALQAYEWP